jgi:hypothetical protein
LTQTASPSPGPRARTAPRPLERKGVSLGVSQVTFRGKNRADVKRKALSYWSCNQRSLGLRLAEFLRACSMDSDECRIVFTYPSAK